MQHLLLETSSHQTLLRKNAHFQDDLGGTVRPAAGTGVWAPGLGLTDLLPGQHTGPSLLFRSSWLKCNTDIRLAHYFPTTWVAFINSKEGSISVYIMEKEVSNNTVLHGLLNKTKSWCELLFRTAAEDAEVLLHLIRAHKAQLLYCEYTNTNTVLRW